MAIFPKGPICGPFGKTFALELILGDATTPPFQQNEARFSSRNGRQMLTLGAYWVLAISFVPFYAVWINTFKHHHELRAFDFNWVICAIDKSNIWKLESADFEALSENGEAINIPPENF